MKLLTAASLALFGVAQLTNAQETLELVAAGAKHHEELEGVIATFTPAISGAMGHVTITDSTDISAHIKIMDFDKISEVKNWPSCSSGGLIWSIQANWPTDGPDEMFGEDCREVENRIIRGGVPLVLGGRYDPGFACSDLSQYQTENGGPPFCDQIAEPNASLWEYLDYLESQGIEWDNGSCPDPVRGQYSCSSCLYQAFHLTCEVGDFSAKYGNLMFKTSCTGKSIRQADDESVEAEAEEVNAQEAADSQVDEAVLNHYCNPGTYVHFKTHDRFMDIPSVYEDRAVRISCNDGSPSGIPLMCARLKKMTGKHHHGKKY